MRRTLFLVLGLLASLAPAARVPGPAVINGDAGWCWFQDERAIFAGDLLLAGTVAAGREDPARRGNIEVSALNLQNGDTTRFVLHERLELDDHDAPALLEIPGGKILAAYSRHGTDSFLRWRVTERPGDISSWAPEKKLFVPGSSRGVTYSNLYHLAAEDGRIYNFFRGPGFDPNVAVSGDNGASFRHIGRLLKGPGRPYVRYASNNTDTVHFICTDQHPRDFDNSLYHGFVRGGKIFKSDGREIGALGSRPALHQDLTVIFQGGPDNVAWPCDTDIGANGRLYVVYSAQKDGAGKPPRSGGMDHRYRYAWLDGTKWRDHEIGFAGRRLYPGEDDYTGLACLDPRRPGTIYLSADVNPATGEPLTSAADGKRHYEIFKAATLDGGETWTFTAITRDSAEDQVRPNVPLGGPEGGALLWLAGAMTTYRNYDFSLLALLPAP